jgi:hypothetical protein
LVESLTIGDFDFEQFGHGFNSEYKHLFSIITLASILFVSRNVGINLAAVFKMSGRGERNNGYGGRGRGGAGRGGRGLERGHNYTGSASAAKRVM